MTKEQAEKVLDELQKVRPEVLNGEAKRLFEAIMKMDNYKLIMNKQKVGDTNDNKSYIQHSSKHDE